MTVETAIRESDVKRKQNSGSGIAKWRSTLFFRRDSMWYVIQVVTGKEEETKNVIDKELSRQFFEDCFYIRRERVWRRDGQCIVHLETMFPGYLFISTDQPEEVCTKLKAIPQITKLLRSEEDIFLTVSQEEREFLENLLDEDPEDVVRLSKVTVNEEKEILTAEGPLRHYVDWIVKKKLRLRYVMIEMELFEKKREILIGIKL